MTAINLDPENLDLGDLEDFEALTGKSLQDALKAKPIYEDGKPVLDAKGRPVKEAHLPVSVIRALVFLTKRKEVEGYTYEDTRSVKISELNFASEDEEGNG
jgi:hypothetical protein